MKSLRAQLRQISRAMEFANVDTYNEFNRLLESHETQAQPSPAPCAAAQPPATRACAYEYDYGRVVDFGAFVRQATLKTAGQH